MAMLELNDKGNSLINPHQIPLVQQLQAVGNTGGCFILRCYVSHLDCLHIDLEYEDKYSMLTDYELIRDYRLS